MHRAYASITSGVRIFWHKYNADIYINTIFEHIFSTNMSKNSIII
jgi:hypothetical protein